MERNVSYAWSALGTVRKALYEQFQFREAPDMNDRMETKYYIVARIDGDYAWLNRTDAEEEPLFIARALLPEEIDEGTKLKYEMLQYEII